MSDRESLQEFTERMKVFLKNREAFPPGELEKYAGQWIAWSPDGASIVAHSNESEEVVFEQLIAGGHDPACCCLSYVPRPDETFVGGLASVVVREDTPQVGDRQ